MNIATHPDLLQLLAASHALGTLRGGARRRFETIARDNPAVRAAALTWQGRLAGMTELQPGMVPDQAVWVRIRNLIEAEAGRAPTVAARPKPAPPARTGWLRSLSLWRGASLAGALATVAAVAVSLHLQQRLDTVPTVQYVAVLTDSQAVASMLVTFDPKHRQLALQRVGNYRAADDKSLQLWALPAGGVPRSLGVLGDLPALTLPASEQDVRAVPALAISVEPKGGVPSEGGPTGPVLFHGALIQKTL